LRIHSCYYASERESGIFVFDLWFDILTRGEIKTMDMGGTYATTQMGDAILKAVQAAK
jgi:isocitrate/isopropylmalate dehydrogenase